jgi:glycosyltransferase involved in cell wall biosynthesis
LNKGLKLARGEYIARQDADDISMPERLKKEVEFLEKHRDYAVVGTFLKILNEDSEIIFTLDKPIEDTNIREFLKKDNCIAHGSAMIRKTYLLNVGLYYNEFIEKSQDYELWLRISEKYKIYNIPEYLYMWRNHNENISIKHRNEQKHFVEMTKVQAKWGREMKRVYYSNKSKFSVLMANYNNSKYIAEAINSILNQTFKDWELVIVNDCSTDNSLNIIKPYLKDERIRLIKNKVNLCYIIILLKN